MDFPHLLNFIRNVNDKKIKKIKNVQDRKLFSLGIEHEITRLNPHDLIFNYSNRILSDEVIEALAFISLKADKGNAIVILNKTDYHLKMNSILSDSSKFKIVSYELFNVFIKKEHKINRLLMKLKKNIVV